VKNPMKNQFSIFEFSANQGEKMESSDHFKNGANPKSHTSRKIGIITEFLFK